MIIILSHARISLGRANSWKELLQVVYLQVLIQVLKPLLPWRHHLSGSDWMFNPISFDPIVRDLKKKQKASPWNNQINQFVRVVFFEQLQKWLVGTPKKKYQVKFDEPTS